MLHPFSLLSHMQNHLQHVERKLLLYFVCCLAVKNMNSDWQGFYNFLKCLSFFQSSVIRQALVVMLFHNSLFRVLIMNWTAVLSPCHLISQSIISLCLPWYLCPLSTLFYQILQSTWSLDMHVRYSNIHNWLTFCIFLCTIIYLNN